MVVDTHISYKEYLNESGNDSSTFVAITVKIYEFQVHWYAWSMPYQNFAKQKDKEIYLSWCYKWNNYLLKLGPMYIPVWKTSVYSR